MALIRTKINPQSGSFSENKTRMLELLDKLEKNLQKSLFQGGEKHISKARSLGKLLARERIDLLLDQDSPFLELMPLAGLNQDGFGPGGTLVAGIGLVSEKLCMVIANVGTNKGGAIDYFTLQKSLRLNEIATENRLPVINLVESAGANLPDQAKIFNYGGATFRDITRRSKLRIPSISVVFGNSTAGGAYVPGMSDYVIMVKEKAKVFLAGPPLVKMATNEEVDDESLGGAEMHSKISGVSDFMAADERDAIRLARELVARLNEEEPQFHPKSKARPPRYDTDEIAGIVPADIRTPFDAREIIARIADDSDFTEFKPLFGNTLVTGFAEIHGYPVGILANNGVLFSDSANKGAHFIQLCNMNNTPLLFLQNITGFMVGRKYEEEGIIKHGAKLINAVSNSTVPSLTVMMAASFGAGNYAMNGRAYQPRFLFSWPNSMIAVMGSDQMAGVMEIIQREAAAKEGVQIDEAQAAMMRDYMKKEFEKQANAWYSTAQLWDDGIIDPRQTRNVMGFCLSVVYNSRFNGAGNFGIFRM